MGEGETVAAQAVRDLSDFLALAKHDPRAAEAFENCLKIGQAVMVADHDIVPATAATNGVIKLQLNETLMAHLAAFRAGKREHWDG